jgi:glycosyltransferase involved in cell wall biosynthesis
MNICIVTYNRKIYLEKCINSILASTQLQYNIFVFDDGSTDGTYEYLQELLNRGVIKTLMRGTRVGTARAFNTLIKTCIPEGWFAMTCDDMWFHRGWDLAAYDTMKTYDDCAIVSLFDYPRWNFDKGVEQVHPLMRKAERTGLGTAFLSKEVFDYVGGFVLPKDKKMGFFASNFCKYVEIMCEPLGRNRLYSPIPHYSTHMDMPHCPLNERQKLIEYCRFRDSEKKNK